MRWSLGLLLWAGPLAAQSVGSSLEFRGHHLGDAEWKAKGLHCSDASPPLERICAEKGTIGDAQVAIAYMFHQRQLGAVLITFGERNYETVLGAFTAKFGQPDSVSIDTLQNRMGAKFLNPRSAWAREEGTLTITRYGSDLKGGRAVMTTRALAKALEASKEAANQKARDDL